MAILIKASGEWRMWNITFSIWNTVLRLSDWIAEVSRLIPNFPSTGFRVSVSVGLLALPGFLLMALHCLWALSGVGPVRKTLSSVVVILLGVPFYILGLLLISTIIWTLLGFIAVGFALLAPVAFGGYLFFAAAFDSYLSHIENQRRLHREGNIVVQDINLSELILGLTVGCLCVSTFGVFAVALTILKSPLVYLGCLWIGSSKTIGPVLSSGCWIPITLGMWSVGFTCCSVILAPIILLSAMIKFVAAFIWPAYVTSGWLRHFGSGGRRTEGGLWLALRQGMKAGYQVMWIADMMTNCCIIMRPDLLYEAQQELLQILQGSRNSFSAQCQRLSFFPPVLIGLYTGSWDIALQTLADHLNVSVNEIKTLWQSLNQQMLSIGQEALDKHLITKEWVEQMPPELFIGLPARVLLETVERSPVEGEAVLASGFVLSSRNRPRGTFADKVWKEFVNAQKQLKILNGILPERQYLCAFLLAGGGNPSDIPAALQHLVQGFGNLPVEIQESHMTVVRPLVSIALACTRQHEFRVQVQEVMFQLAKP